MSRSDRTTSTTRLRLKYEAQKERLEAAELMLTELAALADHAGYVTFTPDEVVHDEDGRVLTIFGTRDTWYVAAGSDDSFVRGQAQPYIIGEV